MIFVSASGRLYVARMIADGITKATATDHGDMWKRGETRERAASCPAARRHVPARRGAAAAAWIASVQLTKASTITKAARCAATEPNELVKMSDGIGVLAADHVADARHGERERDHQQRRDGTADAEGHEHRARNPARRFLDLLGDVAARLEAVEIEIASKTNRRQRIAAIVGIAAVLLGATAHVMERGACDRDGELCADHPDRLASFVGEGPLIPQICCAPSGRNIITTITRTRMTTSMTTITAMRIITTITNTHTRIRTHIHTHMATTTITRRSSAGATRMGRNRKN